MNYHPEKLNSEKKTNRYGHAGVVIQGLVKKTKKKHAHNKKLNTFSKEPFIALLDVLFACNSWGFF